MMASIAETPRKRCLMQITGRQIKMKLTKKQMIAILEEGRINKVSQEEKEQVLVFAFGKKFIKSNDKGSKKLYRA